MHRQDGEGGTKFGQMFAVRHVQSNLPFITKERRFKKKREKFRIDPLKGSLPSGNGLS